MPVRLAVALLAFTGILGCDAGTSQQTTSTPKAESEPLPKNIQASPASSSSTAQLTEEMPLGSGRFVEGEHPTNGAVRIVKRSNQRILRLDSDFSTSTSGPDLFVVLHRSPDVIGSTTPPDFPLREGDYIVLAPLKKYQGAQSYVIPDHINLRGFRSVAIWCRRFNATFGSAALSPLGDHP